MDFEAACAIIWKSDKNQKRELLGCQAATSNNLCEYSLLQAKCSFIYTEALDFSSNSTGLRDPFLALTVLLNTGKTCRIWYKRQNNNNKIRYYKHKEKGEEAGSRSFAHCHGVDHLPHPLVFILLLLLFWGWLIPPRAMPCADTESPSHHAGLSAGLCSLHVLPHHPCPHSPIIFILPILSMSSAEMMLPGSTDKLPRKLTR